MPALTKVQIWLYLKTLFETEAARRRGAAELFDDNADIVESATALEQLATGSPNDISDEAWARICPLLGNDMDTFKWVAGLDCQFGFLGLVPTTVDEFLQADVRNSTVRAP